MKTIKYSGLVIFLVGLITFTSAIFLGEFNFSQQELDSFLAEKNYKNEHIAKELQKEIVTEESLSIFEYS